MKEVIKFFKGYSKSLDVSEITQKNTLRVIRKLLRYDPWNKTRFEVSFKIKKDKIPRLERFLTMDIGIHSSRSPISFLGRLEIYKSIMKGKINNPLLPNVIRALAGVSRTPMDLYFGADIENNNFLFAFWLIFGGVKRTGEISFCPYDFDEIVKEVLEKIKFEPPKLLRKDILNLGLDIDNKNVFYKLYYLLRKNAEYPASFDALIKRIDKTFVNFKYFYFFSQMHDAKGRCCKEKLFVEFLEDLYPASPKNTELLARVCEMNNNYFELERLEKVIRTIDGRISLLSFENDGQVTFYVRACKYG